MAVGAGPVLEEAAVFGRKFDHGAFVVDCRSLVDADGLLDGLLQAEAEQLLLVPTPGGRFSKSLCAANVERVL